MAKLIIIKGTNAGSLFELEDTTSIGRSSENSIIIQGSKISRKHAIITREGKEFIIQDNNSRNGVQVNNSKIKKTKLSHGDVITIGNAVMVFEPEFELKSRNFDSGSIIILKPESSVDFNIKRKSLSHSPKIKELDSLINIKQIERFVSIINASINLDNLSKALVLEFLKVFSAERGALILVNKREELEPAVVVALSESSKEISVSHTVLSYVINKGKPFYSNEVSDDERINASKSLMMESVHSVMCVPVIYMKRIIGVYYLDSSKINKVFNEEDVNLFVKLSQLTATAIENASSYKKSKAEVSSLKQNLQNKFVPLGISSEFMELMENISAVANTEANVLLIGETGTGKEVAAHTIHLKSNRFPKPFIGVDCSAIPEALLESELFGHEKGAFTGALNKQIGIFEKANEGTLFLDEIGNLPLSTQKKLLRVLEERQFTRVGGIELIKTDVRIISATNIDLTQAIKDGIFRSDLFYRIAVVPISLPPLRNRKGDISFIAEKILKDYCNESGKMKKFSQNTIEFLEEYNWPGNIRELKNVVEYSAVLSKGHTINPEDLPPSIVNSNKPFINKPFIHNFISNHLPLPKIVSNIEKEVILEVMKQCNFKKAEAYKILGISRPTLDKKLKEYKINT